MFTGLPDFGRRSSGTAGYVAYEQPGVLCVVPGSLTAEPLQVDQYLQERDAGIAQFAVVTAGFTIDTMIQDDGSSPLLARPAPLGAGLVRLVAPADLDVPAAALAPQPCDAAVGVVLPTLVRLDGAAGELLAGALRGGLRTLGAVALVTVHGVATRCPGTLTVDVDALHSAIGIAPVRPRDLEALALAGLPGVTVTGGPEDPHVVAEAVVDRIVTRLATPAFLDDAEGSDETDGGWLFTSAVPGSITLRWDLSEPVTAVRLLRLLCDPILGPGGDAAIHEHTAPPLTDGREQLLVYSSMPAMPAGVIAASVKLSAPPAPPDRPFAAEATAHLVPPRPAPATLHLAAGETLRYDLEGSAAVDTDRGPRTLTGVARRVEADPTPVVTPADLGLRVIPAHATDGLLDLADVTVTARSTRLTRDPAVFVSSASLPKGDGRAWLAVPRDAARVTLEAVAITRGLHSRTVRQTLPDAAIWLDPFSFSDAPWDVRDEPMLVVEAAGLRVAGPKGGSDWRFLPLTAAPALGAADTLQLSLIEAPGLAMLMVTTSLQVSDAAQATARKACVAAGAAGDVRLSPAPFETDGAVQLLVRRGAELYALGTAVASGTATQDASFSVTLTEADLAVVRRSLAGEAGLLAVHYLLRIAATGPQAQALAGGPDPTLVVTDASTWRT